MWYTKKQSEQQRYKEFYPTIMHEGNIMHIGRLLQQAATRHTEHIALIFEGMKISYEVLYRQAVALSKLLIAKGVQPHDRVLLLLENSPEFYVGYFGIVQVGAVVVPLNIFLKERELGHIIKDSKPVLIITQSEFMTVLQAVGSDLPPVLTENDIPSMVDAESARQFQPTSLPADSMAALLYTSGTTGLPKGVMLSSTNIMINILQGITRFELRPTDSIFGVLPLFHSFAQNTCVWSPMFIGCTVIVVRKIERRAILQALVYKPTIFVGIPALYGLLCLLKTAPLDDVRCFISGGDTLPDRIRAGFELLYRRKICSGYGLTETSPFVSGDLNEETVSHNTVGRPLESIRAEIRDEHGTPLPQGAIGALWLQGPNIMLGYYNEPDMTNNALVQDWFNTGDLAYIDWKGRIVITGRLKDLIINKGFNIYPAEIENCLMGHPLVLRVAVIGVPDKEGGEAPMAFVQIKQEDVTIEKQLRDICQKNLAAYKVPRKFYCSTRDLPMTATGKIDKKKLRSEFAKDNTSF